VRRKVDGLDDICRELMIELPDDATGCCRCTALPQMTATAGRLLPEEPWFAGCEPAFGFYFSLAEHPLDPPRNPVRFQLLGVCVFVTLAGERDASRRLPRYRC
jgi:hypothetical protein